MRRLLRRILVYGIKYDIHADLFSIATGIIKENYGDWYLEVKNTKEILAVMLEEKTKFEKALALGVKEVEKYAEITAKDAFYIYETFGLPWELLRELAPAKVKDLNKEFYEAEFKKHQEISRAGQEKKTQKNIAGFFIGRPHPIRNQKNRGAQMIRKHPQNFFI